MKPTLSRSLVTSFSLLLLASGAEAKAPGAPYDILLRKHSYKAESGEPVAHDQAAGRVKSVIFSANDPKVLLLHTDKEIYRVRFTFTEEAKAAKELLEKKGGGPFKIVMPQEIPDRDSLSRSTWKPNGPIPVYGRDIVRIWDTRSRKITYLHETLKDASLEGLKNRFHRKLREIDPEGTGKKREEALRLAQEADASTFSPSLWALLKDERQVQLHFGVYGFNFLQDAKDRLKGEGIYGEKDPSRDAKVNQRMKAEKSSPLLTPPEGYEVTPMSGRRAQ